MQNTNSVVRCIQQLLYVEIAYVPSAMRILRDFLSIAINKAFSSCSRSFGFDKCNIGANRINNIIIIDPFRKLLIYLPNFIDIFSSLSLFWSVLMRAAPNNCSYILGSTLNDCYLLFRSIK